MACVVLVVTKIYTRRELRPTMDIGRGYPAKNVERTNIDDRTIAICHP